MKRIIQLDKNVSLKEFGYSTKNSDSSRHRALIKAVQKHGLIQICLRLNQLNVLQYKKNPRNAKIFEDDFKYIAKKYKI